MRARRPRVIGSSKTLLALLRLGALLCALGWLSCTASSTAVRLRPGVARTGVAQLGGSAEPSAPHTIVLVALDGVRWQEVFGGVDRKLGRAQGLAHSEMLTAPALMPNLHALINSGVAVGMDGRSMRASGPSYVSLPGYLEMLTGFWPTGCLDNHCKDVRLATVVDHFTSELGVGDSDVAVITSWERIERVAALAPSRAAISTGRSGGQTRQRLAYDEVSSRLLRLGELAGPGPGTKDFRRDTATAVIALHYLRTHRPRFLFLELGECDEHGHANDYRGYLAALIDADQVIGDVAAELVEYGREGRRATLVVTTDHGRDDEFWSHGDGHESGAVWLVAAGSGIQRRGIVNPASPLRLADVGDMIRTLGNPRIRVQPQHALADLLVPSGGFALPPWSSERVAAGAPLGSHRRRSVQPR